MVIDPQSEFRWIYYHLAPCFVILICLTSDFAKFCLNWGPIQYLGKVSYGFYLLQNLTIENVFDSLLYRTEFSESMLPYKETIAVICAVFVNLVAAHFFTKLVDDPSKDFTYRIEQIMKKDKNIGFINTL